MTPATLTEAADALEHAVTVSRRVGTSTADRPVASAATAKPKRKKKPVKKKPVNKKRKPVKKKKPAPKRKAKAPSKHRKKKLPVCTKKDLRTRRSKRRKCRVVKQKQKPKPISPTGPVAAPPPTTPTGDAYPTPPAAGSPAPVDGTKVYTGPFGPAQAERLLWRAGFGPRPGDAEHFAALGVQGAVDALLNPGTVTLSGPAPSGNFLVGGRFAPDDLWGHLHLEWLDRMVRSTDPLGERMALILHDWFAVSIENAETRYVRSHIDLLRRGWRGSLRRLLADVTVDPAMLMFLDGLDNRKGAPNENYARELMELYALGADRGAYTEDDVRELARALTGWRADWSEAQGTHNIRFDPSRFDATNKTLFAGTGHQRSGNLGWRDAIEAVVDHPLHPSFVVLKLWSYFIPTPPSHTTQLELEALYRSSGEQLQPLVRAILVHPDLYQGGTLVKPPAVYNAGLLRARGCGIDTDAWTWLGGMAGQLLGLPPNVSGWNDRAWLNTSTHAARWGIANYVLVGATATDAHYNGVTETAAQAVDAALACWGRPNLTAQHRAALERIANEPWVRTDYWNLHTFYAQRQNVLRQLVVAAPDFQVS